MVLRHVRAAGTSGRAEIARAAGLTTQAVSNIISDLTDEGLLIEVGHRAIGRGLPVVQYAIAANGGHALGIDVELDMVQAVLTDLKGATLWSGQQELQQTSPDDVSDYIKTLCADAQFAVGVEPDRLVGVGVVMPGPFGSTGLASAAIGLPGWERIAPAQFLEARLGCSVVVENDANAAAISERVAGVAQGLDHYVCLHFGAGLGLGIVSDSVLVRGAFGNAGEIGHITFGGKRLEAVASRLALCKRLEAAGLPAHSLAEIESAVNSAEVELWLSEAAAALSEAVTMIENLFDPQTVILGGALPDVLIDALIERIALSPESLAARRDRQAPRLLRGSAGRMNAAHCAAALVVDRLFTPRLDAA